MPIFFYSGVGEMSSQTCWDCQFFTAEPGALERQVPGLNILSSAYSSVRLDNGICEQRGIIQRPIAACAEFKAESKKSE